MTWGLPRILVIDDQSASDPDLRDEFCSSHGLVDISLDAATASEPRAADELVAEAVFCAAQIKSGAQIENSIEEAERAVAQGWPSGAGWRWAMVLLDLRFDSSSPGNREDEFFGLRILEHLVARWPDAERPGNCEIPIVVLSSIERARYGAGANRGGSVEYIEKSQLDRDTLARLLDRHGLLEDQTNRILGRSLALLKILRRARSASSESRGNLLILGEQGVGKTALAHYIHAHSPRRSAPHQSLTVSPGMEPHLLKAQLFGFWYGAYTPADKSEAGLAERAHGSMLFVDEIANLPRTAHQELLEYGRLEGNGLRRLNRLGAYPTAPRKAVEQAQSSLRGQWDQATQAILVDVFLVTATNKPIDDEAARAAEGFPSDLFVRLGQEYHAPIRFPSLRERREDIGPLFVQFLKDESIRNSGVWPKTVDPAVIEAIEAHPWPGNVAELAGVAREVERSTRPWEEVHFRHLPPLAARSSVTSKGGERVERRHSADPPVFGVGNASLADVIRALDIANIHDSRRELEGALKSLGRAYGAVLEKLLKASLEFTRERSAREKDGVLGDLSPTRAINLLLNDTLKTDKAADEIKRLVALLPDPPSTQSEIGRVFSWATNLRKGRKRSSSTKRGKSIS